MGRSDLNSAVIERLQIKNIIMFIFILDVGRLNKTPDHDLDIIRIPF